MAQIDERPSRYPDARVDLVAAVAAREPERELPIGANLGIALGQRGVRHEDVTVLNRKVGAAGAPHDIPGFEPLALERALNTRTLERFEENAVELAVTSHLHGARARAERRHDPRQHAVALLPVQARHMERDARLLAERGLPLELHIRAAGRRPALLQSNPFRVERVDDVASDRDMSERQLRVERSFFLGERGELRHQIRRQLARHRPHVWRSLDRDLALPRLQRPLPERPFETVAARGAAREPQPLGLEKIRQRREIDVGVLHVPRRPRGRRLAERRHPIVEARRAAVQLARRVGDLEPVRDPQHRPAQVRKPPIVDARQRADKRALQLASALEEMKSTGEIADARDAELLAVEKDVLLRWKIDPRAELIELLRPPGEIDVAGHGRSGAVAEEVHPVEVHLAVTQREVRPHVHPERLIRLNLNRAV